MMSKLIKATIIDVIVALFITVIVIGGIYLFWGREIDENISIINKVSIDLDNKKEEVTTINTDNVIENYPEYGTQ